MPNPCVAAIFGAEVRLAIVMNLGGEAQKAPVASGGVRVHSRGREAVLLHGTLQQGHGPVFQVGRLLYNLSVKNQIRCSWGRQTWIRTGNPFRGHP